MAEEIGLRLRLRDARRFQGDADRSARSVRGIGDAADRASGGQRRFAAASDAGSRAMSALGTASRAAGLAVGSAVAAGVAFGVKFNAGMEQNEVAFTNFLGTGKKARAFLDDLYALAAKTPFEFAELTGAARRFLAFGFSANETKKILATVGDTVAGIGGGAAEIDRVTMALGQIQAKGKLSTEELLQLAELGIPAFQILRKELGLTGSELEGQLRKGAIGADKGIAALVKGMNARFAGMSEAQAKTFLGQLSMMRDNASAALGAITLPLFNKLRDDIFPKLNELMGDVSNAFKAWGLDGVLRVLGGRLGIGDLLVRVADVLRKQVPPALEAARDKAAAFLEAIRPAQPFFANVLVPLLGGFAKGVLGSLKAAFAVAIPIIVVAARVLGALGRAAKPLRPVFEGVGQVLGFLFGGVVLRLIGLLGKFGGAFRIVGAVAKSAALPFRIIGVVFGRVFGQANRVVGVLRDKLTGSFQSTWRVADRFRQVVVNVFTAIQRKVRGAVDWIRDKLMGMWNAIPGPIRNLLDGGPAGPTQAQIDTYGQQARAASRAGGAAPPPNPFAGRLPGTSGAPGAPGAPGAAAGGVLSRSGRLWVGERGRELLTLPRAARIDPLPAAVAQRPQQINLMIDGEVFASAIVRGRGGDVIARGVNGRVRRTEALR